MAYCKVRNEALLKEYKELSNTIEHKHKQNYKNKRYMFYFTAKAIGDKNLLEYYKDKVTSVELECEETGAYEAAAILIEKLTFEMVKQFNEYQKLKQDKGEAA